MSIPRRFALAGLVAALALSVCDGPEEAAITSAAEVGDEEVSVADDPAFPLCEPPDPHDALSFEIELGDLAEHAELDVLCEVDATTGGADPSALLLLTCADAAGEEHAVAISLELFRDDVALLAERRQVRLRYRQGAGQDVSRALHVALRGVEDDALLLFAARGFHAFPAASAELWAPLEIAEVDAPLCPAVGACDTHRRTALDITAENGETRRLLDHRWGTLQNGRVEAHVRLAYEVIANANGACPSDAPSGRYSELVVLQRGR